MFRSFNKYCGGRFRIELGNTKKWYLHKEIRGIFGKE